MKPVKSFGIPYWIGAIILGMLNVAFFSYSSKPWGVTTALAYWGAKLTKVFGTNPERWLYFSEIQMQAQIGEYQPFIDGSILIVGTVLGSFISAVVYREFRIRKPHVKKQYIAALIGGLLMGYGARLAGGCSIGALVSGTASLSLHGWIFGIFLFPGVWIGLKVAAKYFY